GRIPAPEEISPRGQGGARVLELARREEPPAPDTGELDRILDKIRVEGMAALTPDERASLDAHSHSLREWA
ncbi:MAG: DUF6576 domain-containing protein, partial [Candidatus Eremiobacterota bacterium]